MQSIRYSRQILLKRKFSLQIFEKYSNINFHQNPSIGSRLVKCGRTDMIKPIHLFAILRTRLKK